MTDDDLERVFRSKFAPLQRTIAPAVHAVIDPECESYFDELIAPAPIVPLEEVVTSLVGLWQESGLNALAALEPHVRQMAKELRAPDSVDQDVPDFVYAMY